ncbi:MAG: M12 family metallo-peptidase, partial [Planctomycetota bacterium]
MVAGSRLDAGLVAVLQLGDGRVWIEPVDPAVAGARPGDHMIYRPEDVDPVDATCAARAPERTGGAFVPETGAGGGTGGAGGGIAGVSGGSEPCVAELACDADHEYYSRYGSVEAVEAQITAVVNAANLQYEMQTGITHAISAIVVRAAEPDPYTAIDPNALLDQFDQHWTAAHADIPRDVAQLFTGKDLGGPGSNVIGIAAQASICLVDLAYGVVQSDFNGMLSWAADLTAHELGHGWNASHCNCSQHTMNPSITGAGVFNDCLTVPDIVSFRDGRLCLDGTCPPMPPPPGPVNDDCADAIPYEDPGGVGGIPYENICASTDGPDNPAGLCFDFGKVSTENDIWFTFTVDCDGTLIASTCDDVHGLGAATYDTDLVVYGPYASVEDIDCDHAALLASLAGCNDDDPSHPCGTSAPFASTVQVPGVLAGEIFLVRVGARFDGRGAGWLSVECGPSLLPEGCCFFDGSCQDLPPPNCLGLGGLPLGAGSSCADDSDGDGVSDCADGCPDDPDFTEPGPCGCGSTFDDSDGDGLPDCLDGCPADPDKTEPGDCGCGVADVDSDGDGAADCVDGCPDDPDKTEPGDCGCGV